MLDYQECKCEVKMGNMVSEPFNVVTGLKQGYLLPELFPLYINFGGQAKRSRDWG